MHWIGSMPTELYKTQDPESYVKCKFILKKEMCMCMCVLMYILLYMFACANLSI